MLQDYKLGIRMLLKYPGLTLAGGLALAIAIGVGAGYYDLIGKVTSPTIPLPEGDRLVLIETHNPVTNAPEPRVVHDFLEWRRELHTIDDLGAYRTNAQNLIIDAAAPVLIQMAELTSAAFGAARVPPLLGRALLDSDEMPGAPRVVVLGYDVWQRSLGGRKDVVGSVVKLGDIPAAVIGVMPDGFAYPINHDAWTPLALRASYGALEGGAITVIGRLAAGVTREQADAELRVRGEQAAAALPATHQHLRPRAVPLGESSEVVDIVQVAVRNLPVLMVLMIACLSVGTLIYARTATREGEIAVRSALGASRGRIIGQLFVEALVLASVAAAVGLVAADRAVTWGIENIGDPPFWMTPGLKLTTIVYASGLAVVSAAMLSFLPALKVTRARMQPHLANLGTGGATLRFGRVWTGAMIAQVALTAIGIPVAMETASQVTRKLNIRAEFPSREYVAARIDLEQPFDEEATPVLAARREQTFAALAQRLAQEPGVIAVTFADRAPGSLLRSRRADVEISPGAGSTFNYGIGTAAVDPKFFEVFDRPIIIGRTFHSGDRSSAARTVIVNEAFVRGFRSRGGSGSPVGARLRYVDRSAFAEASADKSAEKSPDQWFEIVGVVRDFGLNPDDQGNEDPCVFHPASAGTVSAVVMSLRVRDNAGALAARLPVIAADVDPRLQVRDARPLNEWIRERDLSLTIQAAALTGVTLLVLFLSALGIFSLVSVGVSRRTREIGLRAALGANPRHVLAGILSRAVVLIGSGIAAGGAVLLLSLALGLGPSSQPADDIALFARYLGVTSVVLLAACLIACVVPARRALRINPTDALREA